MEPHVICFDPFLRMERSCKVLLGSRVDLLIKTTSKAGNSLAQVETIFQAHIPLSTDVLEREKRYDAAWVSIQVSASIGSL